eukprot:554374-Rhodomonas_salina.4
MLPPSSRRARTGYAATPCSVLCRICCYAPATPCPVLRWAMLLRACNEVSGTDVGYAAMAQRKHSLQGRSGRGAHSIGATALPATPLRASYAMSGTGVRHRCYCILQCPLPPYAHPTACPGLTWAVCCSQATAAGVHCLHLWRSCPC